MIIKASQRGGARNLASHLINSTDNDHVDLYELRGVAGRSLHAALLEIDGVSQGTRSQKPFFSTSFNPPEGVDVSDEMFVSAFDTLEKKLGLTDQPRAIIFHEKEGRRHAHVVWSRVDIDNMKVINMSHFKHKCTDISRQLYLEHGWDMPKGLIDKKERDPFKLSNSEWQLMKRQGVDPKEIKLLCQDAWQRSDNVSSFKHALEERSLYLAQGDRRGFVIVDQTRKVYSLSRYGGIKTKEIKEKLGSPEHLPTVADISQKVRSIYNTDILNRVSELKRRHVSEIKPLQDTKAQLVSVQRAERRELADQQRVKRNIVAKTSKDRFRRGVMGLFDKVTGRERRVKLINQKQVSQLKKSQKESRQKMVFSQNNDRSELQKEFVDFRTKQREERTLLASRIMEFRRAQDRDEKRKAPLSQVFEKTAQKSDKDHVADKGETPRSARRNRTRDRSRDL